MKKLITAFLPLLFSSSIIIAQPSFTSLTVPADGYTASVASVTYSGSAPTIGANQTWNYSSLTFGTPSSSTIHTNVASTPYASSFPTATHYETNTGGSYLYYRYTSSAYSILGLYNGSYGIIQSYSNPQTVMQTPLSYGGSQSDTYSTYYVANSIPITVTGNIVTNYVGYGTLTTDNGTVSNIALLKTVKTETQVMDYGSGMTITMVFTSTTYGWIVPGEVSSRFALLFMDITMEGSPYSSSKAAYLYGSSTTAVQPQLVSAELFPQPTTDQVTIIAPGIQGSSQAVLTTASGTLVKIEEITADADGTMIFSLNDVPAGLYLVEIRNGNKVVREKIAKQ